MAYLNGVKSPETHPPDTVTEKCCARCRRGTPATGAQPCGYYKQCRCHSGLSNGWGRNHE